MRNKYENIYWDRDTRPKIGYRPLEKYPIRDANSLGLGISRLVLLDSFCRI